MRKTMQRVAVTLGAVAVILGMTIGPAAAATVPVSVTWDGVGGSIPAVSPASPAITTGDTVDLGFFSPDAAASGGVFNNGSCDPTGGGELGFVANGATFTLSPTATTTYSFGSTDQNTFVSSSCVAFTVTVNSAPPPDVPEVPYAAWLLVASGALFGGGFFLLRRRAARAAA